MKYSVYLPKEKILEKEKMELEDLSSYISKIDF
jgi:hypothetical protein